MHIANRRSLVYLKVWMLYNINVYTLMLFKIQLSTGHVYMLLVLICTYFSCSLDEECFTMPTSLIF